MNALFFPSLAPDPEQVTAMRLRVLRLGVGLAAMLACYLRIGDIFADNSGVSVL